MPASVSAGRPASSWPRASSGCSCWAFARTDCSSWRGPAPSPHPWPRRRRRPPRVAEAAPSRAAPRFDLSRVRHPRHRGRPAAPRGGARHRTGGRDARLGAPRSRPPPRRGTRQPALRRRAGPRRVKVVVDCGKGVASLVAVETLRELGAEVVPLFCTSDGTFPNHHPDPTVLENLHDLQAAVRRDGAELGIAFDGDGDRIGAVDEQGRAVLGDQLLVLLGRDLARRMGPGHPVIFDVKCSEVLPRELARVGLQPTMWKTGHSLIKQKMKETQAPLAGEMSGHMFFGGDWYGFDDALFAAARLLRYVAELGGPLSRHFADLPATVSTPELRVDCPDDQKFAIVERAARHFARKYPVATLDGVRITFKDGWGLLRASNTQPVLALRFEATSAAALAAYRAEVEGWLAAQSDRA